MPQQTLVDAAQEAIKRWRQVVAQRQKEKPQSAGRDGSGRGATWGNAGRDGGAVWDE
jgi:hypothetical protein